MSSPLLILINNSMVYSTIRLSTTGYNSIVHQTAGHMPNNGTPGKRGNVANSIMALFKNTMNKLVGTKAVPPK